MSGLLKKNEKLIWVVLLVVLAPSFAATGLMYDYFSTQGGGELFEIHGQTWSGDEFGKARLRLWQIQSVFRALSGQATGGKLASDEDTLRYILDLRTAKELGLAVSDDELAKEVRESVKSYVAAMAAQKAGASKPGMNQQQQMELIMKAREEARFTEQAYRDMLASSLMPFRMKPDEFEEVLREGLLQGKVRGMVAASAFVSESEIYDEFGIEHQKRILDYVRVPIDSHLEEARKLVTEEETLELYEADPEVYKVAPRMKLEAYKVDREEFAKANEPTEVDILKKYDADKELRYKKPQNKSEAAGDTESPAPEYIPLEEVRERIRDTLIEEKEKALLDRIIAAGKEAAAAAATSEGGAVEAPPVGKSVDVAQVLADDAKYVSVITTESFDKSEISNLDDRIKTDRGSINSVFSELARVNMLPGAFSQRIGKTKDGSFAMRVVEYQKEQAPEFADCKERVREDVVLKHARELARSFANTIKHKVDTKQATFADAVKESNFTIQSSPALKKTESGKFKQGEGDSAELVKYAREILEAGFQVTEVGGVAEPVVPKAKDSREVVLVSLREIVAADPAEFTDEVRSRMKSRRERAKQEAVLEQFRREQETRANIKQLWEKSTPKAAATG